MNTIVRLFRSKAKDTEKELFIHLVRPHVELMYRMAYRWSGSQDDAEDIVQDVLIKLTAKVEDLSSIENLRPWLIKVVYRQFVDRKRQQNRRLEVVESSLPENKSIDQLYAVNAINSAALAPDHAQHFENEQTVDAALSRISSDQRDVVLLHDAEGYTTAEVAEILSISQGTVKSRLHRGREKLKNILTDGTF